MEQFALGHRKLFYLFYFQEIACKACWFKNWFGHNKNTGFVDTVHISSYTYTPTINKKTGLGA